MFKPSLAFALRCTPILGLVAMTPSLQAQTILPWEEKNEACTSIMVGRKASADGSVMTSHSCDGNFRAWLNITPRKKHAVDAKRAIWWGGLHTETPMDMAGKKQKGEIAQVAETYAFINAGYPFLNEKQLAMGETTIGGRRELQNDKGLFLVEELQAIALERCTTAREAIKLMGSLAEEFGYGDGGECLTIADPKEVWHFEIMGAGKDRVGATWAAVRIPDDHVGVSANIVRIAEVDLTMPDRYMASKNIHSLAQEMGWWDGKAPFKFWKAYSGRKPFGIRDFHVLSTLAPSLGLKMDMEELPLSVKPEKPVSAKDVFAFFRSTFEGTAYDRTRNLMVPKPTNRRPGEPAPTPAPAPELVKSPAVNPWLNGDTIALLNAVKPGVVENQRTIAVPQCAYSHVIQVRSWLPDEVGGVAWFSFDNPGQSPRIPIFSGTTQLPKSFEICMNKKFRTDSVGWWFRRANRLSQVRWGQTKDILNGAILEYEQKGLEEVALLDQRVKEILKADPSPAGHDKVKALLTRTTDDFARSTMQRWWEMGDHFWTLFARGF